VSVFSLYLQSLRINVRDRSGYVYELHLRSLSTNKPHSKAPMPVLPCLARPSNIQQATDHITPVRVQVSGDLVALLVKEVHDSNSAHLEIWDWLNNPQLSVSPIILHLCHTDLSITSV
jgi:hypothetical protein